LGKEEHTAQRKSGCMESPPVRAFDIERPKFFRRGNSSRKKNETNQEKRGQAIKSIKQSER